ncbi:hypothetical protein TNCV_2602981 [Trichonephila clavipes]|nr:hypothetical protein TNCV_2602981 [Trichonephila clavipes]
MSKPELFSFDITPTTNGRENTNDWTPLASRNLECNSRCKNGPPQPQESGETVRVKHSSRDVVCSHSSITKTYYVVLKSSIV